MQRRHVQPLSIHRHNENAIRSESITKSWQGNPSWYELTTSKGDLKSAQEFYSKILAWTFEDSGMEGYDYLLASCDGDAVAGLSAMPEDATGTPPFWLIYFAVDDADKSVADAKAAGAVVHRVPSDVPGTGRFALLTDPQGADFGVLQPDMSVMSDADIAKAESGGGAFNQDKPGHGNWHELISTDPVAGFKFYARLLGWGKGDPVDLGDMGTYQLFRRGEVDIGGMMGLGDSPESHWLPYFGVSGSVSDKIEAIKAAGGRVQAGPMEVPGGAYTAVAQDPQGAWFAIVGSDK